VSPVIRPPQISPDELSRRHALQLLAGGAASLAAGCSQPDSNSVARGAGTELPYVHMPEGLLPGVPQHYATALPLAGYGRGVVVTAFEGRPTKVEGNPRHPASLGATDVFAQAETLSLYDPDRSQAIRLSGEISDWPAFESAFRARVSEHGTDKGGGLRLLTGRVTSPTLLDQITSLQKALPEMRWHVYEPTEGADDEAARAVYGEALRLRLRLRDANTLIAFDADPLGPGPDQVANARALADRRRRDRASVRLYSAESALSLTGAFADRRLTAHPDAIEAMIAALAAKLGASIVPPALSAEALEFLASAARDLTARPERGLVVVGPTLSLASRALGVWINDRLGGPFDAFAPDDPAWQAGTLAGLAGALRKGEVRTLIMLDCNPVAAAPGDLGFADLMARAPFRVHAGLYFDETAAASTWHTPTPHPLESWSDIASPDGAVSLVQPLIRPLWPSWSAHTMLALMAGEPGQSDYHRLRAAWRARWGTDGFEARWRKALIDGVVGDTAPEPVSRPGATLPDWTAPAQVPGFALVYATDTSIFDGRFANNAWLQECPQPFSKAVWGNAIEMADADAARLGIREGDEVEIVADKRRLSGPVRLANGLAPGVLRITLGYGRTRAGRIGNGVGINAAILRASASPWITRGAALRRVGGDGRLSPAVAGLYALPGEARKLAPELTPGAALPPPAPKASFNTPTPTPPGDPYAWAMSVDTDACIGCNACVVACQSENNVPSLGPDQIRMGRDMHWLRIDVYDHGEAQQPRPVFQPVPCMQCETAPCEPVCPVEASVHDHEGLNVQVYNRCVGTRFCESNCPYKVRRFNFFGYADGQEYGDLGDPLVKAANNPNVSVRARGVMEKCTYCVQRISAARRLAERETRLIAEGEVVTACQGACPTQAIRFGNLADPKSAVSVLRHDPRHYTLLEELHTRPRTTYLARVRNAGPEGSKA
jgi:molybdopterin-containing oxidoreductase family iron-sulfur binding subunit